MGELKDYSGEFDTNLRYEDFSKEALIRLLKEYGNVYLLLDGMWNGVVKEKLDIDHAMAYELEVWKRMAKFELKWVAKALNVKNDLVGFMKVMRFTPAGFLPASFDWEVDFLNENEAVLTITRCHAVEVWEKQGDASRINLTCNIMEVGAMRAWCATWNENLRCEPLLTPPRKSKDAPFCRWRYVMETGK